MKRTLKYLAMALGLFLVSGLIYYSYVIIKARIKTPLIVTEVESKSPMPLKSTDLSEWQLRALLTVEDPRFFEHKGIDFSTPGAGLTTMSQGLAKQLYFRPFKPGMAKIELILITRFAFDPLISKERQLTLFLNRVYLGKGKTGPIHGFEGASQTYLGKSFKELTEKEFLSLVAMVISPKTFHITDKPQANRERTERIERLVKGLYSPKGLMDLYYGEVTEEEKRHLPKFSYFPHRTKEKREKK